MQIYATATPYSTLLTLFKGVGLPQIGVFKLKLLNVCMFDLIIFFL